MRFAPAQIGKCGTAAAELDFERAARWRKVLGAWPVTEAFPGGSE